MPAALKGMKTIQAPASLKDMALAAIKGAIWDDVLQPGPVYSEAQLAQELGISRTPIREAVMELAGVGFLTIIPRKGFRLKRLSLDEIQQLFTFRRVIELAVTKEMMPRLSEEHLAELKDIHNRDRAAVQDMSSRQLVGIDREFHTFLATVTGNQYLISAHETMRDLIDWVGTKVLKRPERYPEAVKEHGAIVEQILQKDLEGTLQSMENHINITERLITAHVRAEQEEQ